MHDDLSQIQYVANCNLPSLVAANVSSHQQTCTSTWSAGFVRNEPAFLSAALLWLERKTWITLLGFFVQNIDCGVLIG